TNAARHVAVAETEQILVVEDDLAGVDNRRLRHDAEHCARQRRLAATGFAHHAENPSARPSQLHMIETPGHAVVGPDPQAQVPHLEQRLTAHRERLKRGSTLSRRPSPSRLKPSTVRKMASPGKVENHQASGKYWRLSEMASPQ